MEKGVLLLLPNLLEETASPETAFPPIVAKKVFSMDGLIAESPKGARRFLRHFSFAKFAHMSEMPIQLLNEHTRDKEVEELLIPILKGETWGLISDSGLPCIADPGSMLVSLAYKHSISVETFPGPSSILMALQLSGLPAQSFCFHGYVKKSQEEALAYLKQISKDKKTHIFIETPYRSLKLLQFFIQNLPETAFLCMASNLTGEKQNVTTRSIANWKKMSLPEEMDAPAVFLFY